VFTYSQSSGILECDERFVTVGYAGFSAGKNNPAAQAVARTGPIPQGMYTIGAAKTHDRLGPCVMALTPDAGNEMFGRSEFYIHGDNPTHPGQSSDGCVVIPSPDRQTIAQCVALGDNRLLVTE
jgi:hypothetical protein